MAEHGWSGRPPERQACAREWRATPRRRSPNEVKALASHVYLRDRELASQVVGTLGETLESLGIEAPPPPPPMALLPGPPHGPKPAALRDLVDAIVCAVAEQADVSVPGALAKTVRKRVGARERLWTSRESPRRSHQSLSRPRRSRWKSGEWFSKRRESG